MVLKFGIFSDRTEANAPEFKVSKQTHFGLIAAPSANVGTEKLSAANHPMYTI